MKGTYCLLIKIEKPSNIKVGKLGLISFRRGYYVYVGSALNNLEKRINRHLKAKKKKFWHIDYLLENKNVKIKDVFYKKSTKKVKQVVKTVFIDIVEKNAINQRMPTRPTELLMKRRKFVEKYYSETPIVNNIQVPDIKIGNVINVNAGNIKETIDKVEEQLAKNIKTTGTKINESLNQFLMGEQPNNR